MINRIKFEINLAIQDWRFCGQFYSEKRRLEAPLWKLNDFINIREIRKAWNQVELYGTGAHLKAKRSKWNPLRYIQPMATRCECGRIIKTDGVHIQQGKLAACVTHFAKCWDCNMTFILRNIKTTGDNGDGI